MKIAGERKRNLLGYTRQSCVIQEVTPQGRPHVRGSLEEGNADAGSGGSGRKKSKKSREAGPGPFIR